MMTFIKFKYTIILFIGLAFFIFGGWFLLLNQSTGDAGDFSEDFSERIFTELIFTEDAHRDEVIILDTSGNIIKKIKVGGEPHDIAVSPNQKFVATANFGDGTVSIINTNTLLVEKTIKTGKGAHGVVFDSRGEFLFVANSEDDTLSVIETASFTQQEKIKIDSIPEYVGVTKDGSRIFTTNLGGDGSVTILKNDGFKSQVIETIFLGIDPHGWAVSPDGSKIVITNLGSNFTYLLDAETFKELAHIDTGATTEFAAFRDDKELWVTDIGNRYISVIDVENNEVLKRIEVGETPHGISFSIDKTLAFVPLYEPGELVVIDVVKRKVTKQIKIGNELHNSVVVNLDQ